MKYSIENENGVVVISVKSNLEGGPDTFQIKDDVAAKIAEGEKRFILDMEKASFVNSTGIGVVIAVQSSISNSGGKLRVVNVSDRARRAFVVTGVWSLFDVCADKADALAAFAKEA